MFCDILGEEVLNNIAVAVLEDSFQSLLEQNFDFWKFVGREIGVKRLCGISLDDLSWQKRHLARKTLHSLHAQGIRRSSVQYTRCKQSWKA